ncbi:MAG: HIT domain-containing protein [Phycisphaerales bacterium]|nr:HIT domain-containing protein [Phycisphaerales bacterium]
MSSPAHPDFPPASVNPSGPDSILQAPWRLEYLEALSASEKRTGGPPPPSSGSFLRDYWLAPHSDLANHVIVRSAHGMVLLNAFPYANGHLLIALGEGKPRLLDYDAADRARLWTLADLATDLVERTLECQGVNVGLNQGRAAGAGVPGHLHVHAVPRWGGDSNFISVVGRVRVIPSSLSAMAQRLRTTWQIIEPSWREAIAR